MKIGPNDRASLDSGRASCLAIERSRSLLHYRSATRNMHNHVLFFSLIALLSAGCAHQKQQPSMPPRSPVAERGTLRTGAGPAVVTNQLTTFGNHSIAGIWQVQVSSDDRTVEVGSYGTSDKPSAWRAQDGWFVLVENDRRVWAYDGDRDLLLFESTKNPEGGPAGKVAKLSGPHSV